MAQQSKGGGLGKAKPTWYSPVTEGPKEKKEPKK